MSARLSLSLNSAIFLLYYTCGVIEYTSAQPTAVHILHAIAHGFNNPQAQQSPDPINFDGTNGGYMAIQVERHPWERRRFRHRNGYGHHNDFIIAQPNYYNSDDLDANRLANVPQRVLNFVAGPLEAPRVNVPLTEDTIIPHHPWHNPHGRGHHHRWHLGHRSMIFGQNLSGENLQDAGYEAEGFGQTAVFDNTNNGIREWENIGPQRTSGREQIGDAVTDITTSTTMRAVTTTTTETAQIAVDTTEPIAKTYETTTVNNSDVTQKADATVTTEPTESTFAIDIRSGFA